MLRADWLDEVVWADCRKFILNPGEALKEAQQQLHSRMAQVAHLEQQRAGYIHALGEKAMERERILTLFRRGRVALDDAETQLDEIAREEADLRQHLMAIDAQKTLAEAFESHMTEARLLLTQLHTRLAEIEQTQDFAVMRQVVEVLVRTLRIDTHEGATPRRKHATVTITYAFSPQSVAVSSTGCDTETPRRQGQST